MGWLKDKWNQLTDWWKNDVRANDSDNLIGDILQEVNESFLGEGSYMNNLANHIGETYNNVSGAYSVADYEDAIADENATVAFERQKELMALEQSYNSPQHKAQQLAQAGLNPALASGVSNSVGGASAQMSSGGSARPTGNAIGDLLGLAKLRNDNRLVQADVELKQAQAAALIGEESRNKALFPVELQTKMHQLVGIKQTNEYQSIVNYIAENTKEGKIAQSKYSTQILFEQLRINRQTYENLEKDGELKDEMKQNLIKQRKLLEGQIFEQEIGNTLGVFNYEQFTGKDYYTGEKIGDGLAQLLYDKAYYDADRAATDSEIAEFEKLLSAKELSYYDVNMIIDNALKVTNILDIVHDDIYSWMSDEQQRSFQMELEKFKNSNSKRVQRNENNNRLFLRILPFILSRLAE